jgi:hypothetical protein
MNQRNKPIKWSDVGGLSRVLNFVPENLALESAWIGHLPFANWIINQVEPGVFVELGTHAGTSYFAFCQSVKSSGLSTKCFAVDSWSGDDHAGYYSEAIFNRVSDENQKYKSFSALIRKNFDDAVEGFENNSIDILHIDGLHTYEAVRHDFLTWLPKLSPTAYVLFHDTNVLELDFGVNRFWNEISKEYKSIEFFHAHGLGILQLGASNDSFIPTDPVEKAAMRSFFETLNHYTILRQDHETLLAELNSIQAEYRSLSTEMEITQKYLREIENSLSWRATAPIRRTLRPLFRDQS